MNRGSLLMLVLLGCAPPPAAPAPKPNSPPSVVSTDTVPAGVMIDREAELIPDPWDRSWNRVYMLRNVALSSLRRTGELPADLPELVARSGFDFQEDAWGTPLQYSVAGKNFELRSAGPDRQFGTGDDIVADQSTMPSPREHATSPE